MSTATKAPGPPSPDAGGAARHVPPAPIRVGGLTAAEVAASSPFALARMVKIDAEHGPEPFVLWLDQRRLLRLLMSARKAIVLKARQLGVTWTMALYALWFALSRSTVTILIVSIGEREAKKVKSRLQRLYLSLPSAVRAHFPVVKDNEQVLEIGHRDGPSAIWSLPASDAAGRGETAHLVIGDEAPHWEHAEKRLAALLPTAEDVGQMVVAGTANGVGGWFYDTFEEAPANGWESMFIGAGAHPSRTPASIAQMRDAVPHGLGAQEYPMSAQEAFIASGKCVFSTRHLQEHLERVCERPRRRGDILRDAAGVAFHETEHGAWRVWRWREAGRRYLITADPCGGGGGLDFAAAAVYDIASWEQVAAYHGRPEPDMFARDLIRAGWLWKDDLRPALVCPELNDHGRAVISILRERRYPHLWTHQRIDQRRDARQVEYGWLTTSQTRPIMIAALQEGVRESTMGIRDREAIGEMYRFVEKPSGRQEADDGAHDDRVMCHAIAAVVLQRQAAGVRPHELTERELTPYRKRRSARTGY